VHAWLFYGAACNMDLGIEDESSGHTLAKSSHERPVAPMATTWRVFLRAAHGLGCAPGLQATVFVVLACELARLWRAKIDLSAWLWGNARNPHFFPAELVAVRVGDFGRRWGGSRGLWREGESSFARDGALAGG
jgi:hypothetical protein